ncbi:MAG: oligosaccharide flippase family protein [Lachnospiraceae bacterium]
MSRKREILKGTIILTAAGLFSRILGFYNRIFLSRTIGATSIGIYHLIFPILMFLYSITVQGISTTVSKMVAAMEIRKEEQGIRFLMRFVLLFSISLSLILCLFTMTLSPAICKYIIKESSCLLSLRLALVCVPFVTIKGCIQGYHLGRRDTMLPASTQLIEQLIRIVTIYLLSNSAYILDKGPYLAVIGMLFGEAGSCIYTILFYQFKKNTYLRNTDDSISHRMILHEFFQHSIPLTGNRMVMSGLQSVETVLLPYLLTGYFHSYRQSVSMFGIVTGMVTPLIYFPTAFTNSLSQMLLPTISGAMASGEKKIVKKTAYTCMTGCILFGLLSMIFYITFSETIGNVIYQEPLVGTYLKKMAYLCPLIYMTGPLGAIMNGLGETKRIFFHYLVHNLISLLIILLLIPRIGITGYFYAIFISEAILNYCNFITIMHRVS